MSPRKPYVNLKILKSLKGKKLSDLICPKCGQYDTVLFLDMMIEDHILKCKCTDKICKCKFDVWFDSQILRIVKG